MFLVRAVLGENLTCASTTLSSLCACLILRRIAVLILTRSRKPLVTLCLLDRSRCGTVII